MHLLIIGLPYEPDLAPSAALTTLLSETLVRRGHQVTVISSVPHYPTGRVEAKYQGKLVWRSVENGVEVIRAGVPSINRKSLPQRAIQMMYSQVAEALCCIGRKYDLVLSGSPSLVVLLPFFWAVILKNKPAVYSVNDVYPDVGIKLGVFKNKAVISTVAALERFCFRHSAIIQVISDSFRPALHALGVPDSKIALAQLWVDTDLVRPLPRENGFAREYGLTDPFVVSYAGNLGLSQGLEHVLDAAELLADQKDIRFVFVGNGSGREQLENQAKQRNLLNIQFISFQPRERLPEVLASADVSLVILKRGIGADSLPSKTFSIMASGRPILASVDQGSEVSKLILRAEAGLSIPPEDPAKIAEAILALKQDPGLRERLGCNGRIWAEQHHSPQHAAEVFERLFSEAVSSK